MNFSVHALDRKQRRELAELARWAASLADRADKVKRQGEALQREARGKGPQIQALRERLERELGPSEMCDDLIGQIASLQSLLEKLVTAQV
jgi:hypothetical protein